jgi:hypothetical protein
LTHEKPISNNTGNGTDKRTGMIPESTTSYISKKFFKPLGPNGKKNENGWTATREI